MTNKSVGRIYRRVKLRKRSLVNINKTVQSLFDDLVFTRIVTSVRTNFQTIRYDKDYKDKTEQFQKVQRTDTRIGSKDEYLHRGQ